MRFFYKAGIVFLAVGLIIVMLNFWKTNTQKKDLKSLNPKKNFISLFPSPFKKNVYTVAAAGDLVCESTNAHFNNGLGTTKECKMNQTADLVIQEGVDAVLTLGDNQYDNGTHEEFLNTYDKSWGVFKNITYPSLGNHDYYTKGAAGYFAYFGKRAGDEQKGYYSFDLGSWHIIALNSNCASIDGCGMNSLQTRWLMTDLEKNQNNCILAYWHHPLFSSGPHGDNVFVKPFWQILYRGGADIVLNGHDHIYERFTPQDPDGLKDAKKGIREFIAGTGGRSLYTIKNRKLNSEIIETQTYGILKLILKKDMYEWKFIPETGKSFQDSGRSACHD